MRGIHHCFANVLQYFLDEPALFVWMVVPSDGLGLRAARPRIWIVVVKHVFVSDAVGNLLVAKAQVERLSFLFSCGSVRGSLFGSGVRLDYWLSACQCAMGFADV